MNITYEEAMRQLENNELDVDQMGERLKTAQQLIKYCRDKLAKTDKEIKKALLNA